MIREQVPTGKPFDKTMENGIETMENELIMIIYIIKVIENELVFKAS